MTSTGLPLKHHPTMTLTRSMCAKLASQPAAEEMFQTPQKTMEMTFTASPRSLPTPPTVQLFICHLCRKVGTRDSDFSNNVSLFKFNDFTEDVNRKFSELELKCENLSDQINTIVQSIISHKKIINELELEIADLIISHSSSPARVTESYSSAPPSKSVPSSDCVPASSSAPPCLSASPSRAAPASRSALPSPSAPPSRSAPSLLLPLPPVLPLLTVLPLPPILPLPPVMPVPLILPLIGVLLLLCLPLPSPDILPH